MRKRILAVFILALVPCLGLAQSSDYSKGQAYFYFAPGGRVAGHYDWDKPTIHFGVGGEGYFRPHWGVGADVAYLRSPEGDRVPVKTFIILSPRILARLRVPDERNRVEPFVTGGYSLINRQDSENGVPFGFTPKTWWETDNGMNFGGGVNWWFARTLGLRLELRDCIRQPFTSDGEGNHLVSFHIGLTVR